MISTYVVEYPHCGDRLCDWLKDRILEWNIDKKLFSIVVDNASVNGGMLDGIRTWLNGKGLLVHHGDMFHIRCSAHIVNLIVKKGMEVIHRLIEGIRKCVKYINHSLYRDEIFYLAFSQTRLTTKKRVGLNVETRWNSTYEMLRDALELKEAFERLADLDNEYKLLPTKDEWERIYVNEWQLSDVDYIHMMIFFMQDKFEYEDSSLEAPFGCGVGDQVERSSGLVEASTQSSLDFRDFGRFVRERSTLSSLAKKIELEQYLEESLFPFNEDEALSFDILQWWRHYGKKFPTLSKLARDILAIPASTVASDTRALLNSETVESLLCTKDLLPPLDGQFQALNLD
ncbi:zinc finger BED domain-containing protein RICESLEEPER 2-like [Tasmannia lanceolata]|uniref:zinc finger BED domain-containing protein RICESLEEPER 2-like n=1 Tax=Tasmannia lanceolata TaxID=3420 RepID=UPI004063DC97